MEVICMEGRAQCVVEGREYRLAAGDLFVYMPGQVISDILLSQNADVKVIAFAQRAIDRSLYLHKFVKEHLGMSPTQYRQQNLKIGNRNLKPET